MPALVILVAALFSIVSTAIMSYISLTVPIGPWIESTLVLSGMIIFGIIKYSTSKTYTKNLGITTAAGSIGGILATGLGFSFPTIYFLEPTLFANMLSQPFYFAASVTGLSLAAGSFGLLGAYIYEHKLLHEQKLAFPIGELIAKMITAADKTKQTIMLAAGFIVTQLGLFAQTCVRWISPEVVLCRAMTLGYGITIPAVSLQLTLLPMLLAIGFITGHVIAQPLIIGLLSKILVIEPLHYLYTHSPLFNHALIKAGDFTISFGSGIVLFSASQGLIGAPKALRNSLTVIKNYRYGSSVPIQSSIPASKNTLAAVGAILLLNILFLSFFTFSCIAQGYLLLFTFLCMYEIALIAGKMGIAPLGRFATIVMVPGMLMFGLNALQITLVATFVEIACGVTCDALFSQRMAAITEIPAHTIRRAQWFGLIISSLSAGIIIFLLIKSFGLGPDTILPATRASSRAALVAIQRFDVIVLLFGFVFGYLLTLIKASPMLVFGGIFMPVPFSLLLIMGGFLTYATRNKEAYYPLWSGVFAANSLWMVIQALFKL